MKKVGISLVVIVVLLSVSVMGCSKKEVSSREEAIYATRELPGCKEIVYYLSVRSSNVDSNVDFYTYTFRIGGSKARYQAAHIVVYKDKEGSAHLIVWDDKRPPQEIKVEE